MAGDGNITVWINSPGGDCVAAAQIYNMLMDYPHDVTVKIDGIAASAASVIAMAGTKVLMSPVSMLISYDLSNIAALTWSSESVSPELAMQRVFQNTATAHSFTCQTDYSEAKPFSVAKPQSVRACLGGVADSFLDLWGGEYE